MSIGSDLNILRRAHERHERVQTHSVGESLTVQNEIENCDINNIMKKYEKTGLIDHVREHPGQYVDLVAPESYHAALNVILEAQSSFHQLPAALRKRFNNDPAEMLAFTQDDKNIPEMRELGMLPPLEAGPAMPAPEQPQPTAADPAAPAAPPSPAEQPTDG